MVIVGVAFLCIFLLRDVQLLSSGRLAPMPARLGLYSMMLFGSMLPIGTTGAQTPAELFTVLRSPRLWVLAISLHLLSAILSIVLSRKRRWDLGWLVALLPSPIAALFLFAVSREVTRLGLPGSNIGSEILVCLCWTLMAGAAVRLARGAMDCQFALEFAAVSNSTALILLPFAPF